MAWIPSVRSFIAPAISRAFPFSCLQVPSSASRAFSSRVSNLPAPECRTPTERPLDRVCGMCVAAAQQGRCVESAHSNSIRIPFVSLDKHALRGLPCAHGFAPLAKRNSACIPRMVYFRISLRIRTRSITDTRRREKLDVARTISNKENQIPRVRREEASSVIPVSATAAAAVSSTLTLTLTSSQSSSAAASTPTPSEASITASQADNTSMSFSKSTSNSSSAFSSLSHDAVTKILILGTASSDQAAFITAACADSGPRGNGEAGSDAAHATETFRVGGGGDNGVHSSLDEDRVAMDSGILLRFRDLGRRPVCFITTAALDGGLESVRRLEAGLRDVLSKENAKPAGVIFLHSATETLEPAVVDALEVVVGGREEMRKVFFVSSGWKDLSARELKQAELQQQLLKETLCARMNEQIVTIWRCDGSASSAEIVVDLIVVNDDALRAMARSPHRLLFLPWARAAGTSTSTRWFPPWLKWLLFTILTLSLVMNAVGYVMAAVAAWQVGQGLTYVGWELTRVASLLAVDPQAAGVVLKEVLREVVSGEELAHVAEDVTRVVGLLGDDPKTAGVVLKEALSGVMGVEHWPAAGEVNLWRKIEVVGGVMRQTDSVKLSEGIEGVARVLVDLLKLLGDDRETVARTLAGVLEKLGDDREALAGTATKIMYEVLGDSPETAVLFLKDFWDGIFAGDAKPGPAWSNKEGDGQGRRPNGEMEMLADLADARSKSGATKKELEKGMSLVVGGQGREEFLAQQLARSAKWFSEVRDSKARRDRDAAAQDARWRSGVWVHVLLAFLIGLMAAVFLTRRPEGV